MKQYKVKVYKHIYVLIAETMLLYFFSEFLATTAAFLTINLTVYFLSMVQIFIDLFLLFCWNYFTSTQDSVHGVVYDVYKLCGPSICWPCIK